MALISKNRVNTSYSKLLTATLGKASESWALDNIFVEDKFIVSTNGKSLTAIESKTALPVKQGMYLLKANQLFSPVETSDFPKWQEIIPEHKEFFPVITNTGEFVNIFQWNLGKNRIAFSICDNLRIIKALKGISWDWELWYGSGEQPIVLKTETELARVVVVAMPFAIEGEVD